MTTKPWVWISDKIIGQMTFRMMGYPRFPIGSYHDICRDILKKEPNTFYTFASTDSLSLASILIRYIVGKGNFNFTHAGIFVLEDNEPPKIMHMKGEGLLFWDLLELLREIDYICINKIILSPENYIVAKGRIKYLVDNRDKLKYDYAQRIGYKKNKFYCSETNFFIFDGLTSDSDLQPEILHGIKTFSPDKVTKIGEVAYSNHENIKTT